jgi:DnaJ homologue, subfamily C, member 28, conserved domain
MDSFERIAENRILEAIEAGLFDNLQGKGQPLNLEDDSHIPPELKMAYKILKNADCLPPELELRREIITLQDLVASLEDEAEKLKQMRRLNFLMMKMGLMRPVSPQILEHELYAPKVLEKLETKKRQRETQNAKLETL